MVPVEQFIVAAAEAPSADVAEFSGLFATTFLMSFQFLGVAEASYVANLHFLTAVNVGKAIGRIGGRNDAGTRASSFAPSSHSSPFFLGRSRLRLLETLFRFMAQNLEVMEACDSPCLPTASRNPVTCASAWLEASSGFFVIVSGY